MSDSEEKLEAKLEHLQASLQLPAEEVERRLQQVRQCHALASLSESALRVIVARMLRKQLQSGDVLFEQNEPATNLYIIISGSVLLYMPWGDEELPLVMLDAGEMFGEAEYFENNARSASARAHSACELLVLPFADLPDLFAKIPDLYPSFVAQRLSETNKRFRQSIKRSRVAERSLKQMSEFLDLSDMSAMDEGSEGLIRRIVHMASKVMKADRATLFLIDPKTGNLWSKVAQGEGMRTITVPSGSGLAGGALEDDEILNVEDVYQDARFNRQTDLDTGYRTKNMLCGPIKNAQGSSVGVIQVINKLVGSFDDEDISLFKAFSHQAAVAVENFYLFNRLRVSNERMTVMLDVLDSVTSTQNMAALIGKVIEKTIAIMQCERASFFVLDRANNELWSLKAVGDELEEIRFPADKGIGGFCAQSNQIINVADAYADERFNQDIDQKTGFRTRNLLAVPVHDREGVVIGVVESINKIGSLFSKEDEQLLRAISAQIGEALKKAALLDDLKKSNIDLTTYNLELERKVTDRTSELKVANDELLGRYEELKRLNELKSEFLGIAAHDLRNPLANISSLSEILQEHTKQPDAGILDPTQQLEFIGMIRDSAIGMLKSLEDLMNTESLDSGEPSIEKRPMSVIDVVRRVIDMNRPYADKKGIYIADTYDDDIPPLMGDMGRLREVFDNLISNAVKYSEPGKRVWVSMCNVQAREPRVRISVKDEGPGMQASDLKEVFGKFKKLSARPTGGESSSGLGLYIVKKLTEMHGGSCWVESVYGQGATFYVELPVGHVDASYA